MLDAHTLARNAIIQSCDRIPAIGFNQRPAKHVST